MEKSINKFFTPKEDAENRYYVEDFDEEKDSYNNYVTMLAEHIPNNARVLDLGCAQGRFGKILKKKDCTVIGIELDEKAAKCAQETENYNKVYVADMTDTDTEAYQAVSKEEKFDVILMTDILEHIVEPTEMIKMYEKVLKEKGSILISVPNFANIKVVLDLLNNQIAYSDVGILDNTHLKWYTKTSFVQWIKQMNNVYEDINFDCEYLGATMNRDDFCAEILEQYPELYEILSNNDNINSFQILFKLTKLNQKEKTENLDVLYNADFVDIVDCIGNALKGKTVMQAKKTLSENERFQYEKRLEALEKSVKETHDGWKAAVASNEIAEQKLKEAQEGWNDSAARWKDALTANEELNKQLKEAQAGWNECAKNWQAAVNANADKDKEINNLKEEYEEREEKLKQKITRLYERINEIEATLNPIIERDLELQKENNLLKEKGAQPYDNE